MHSQTCYSLNDLMITLPILELGFWFGLVLKVGPSFQIAKKQKFPRLEKESNLGDVKVRMPDKGGHFCASSKPFRSCTAVNWFDVYSSRGADVENLLMPRHRPL